MSEIKKYRAKPVVKEAVQFESFHSLPKEFKDQLYSSTGLKPYYFIKTLEGEMIVNEGDFIIKGLHGEFYPCEAEIFHKSYELIKPQPETKEVRSE